MLEASLVLPARNSSAMTIISVEATGLPLAPTRTPFACLIRSLEVRSSPELSSASEPPRMTIATSVRPVAFRVLSNPVAMANRAVNTATTPARPMTITSDGAHRSGMLFTLMPVTAIVWLNIVLTRLLIRCRCLPTRQRIDDFQPPGPQCGQQSHGNTHDENGGNPDGPDEAIDVELKLTARALLHHGPEQCRQRKADH